MGSMRDFGQQWVADAYRLFVEWILVGSQLFPLVTFPIVVFGAFSMKVAITEWFCFEGWWDLFCDVA